METTVRSASSEKKRKKGEEYHAERTVRAIIKTDADLAIAA